ncbi:MAG: dipicolinate synthase subunit DpsA [Clostridiaceae bacterium]|nr:dipicolinate synthase [Clostridiales bacterium]MDD6877988.1 dipicolinate synthase subunit DpsA [Clostridiaceae bacterium]MDY3071887.1 dipicolinate synthase subunit DpsA [Eubacteriales bacterium]MDY3286555.1 dipicolinate synthase subunit DpsA [Eubacteriales bacterium]MDY5014800.1 dipicolinate synthase subunit DpsA [Eubacteriales bacterium]
MDHPLKAAVLGGDRRFAHLAAMLARDGCEVCTACAVTGDAASGVRVCESPREALEGARAVVLPLPVLGADGRLNAPGVPESRNRPDAYALLAQIPKDCVVCGGLAPSDYGLCAARHGLRLVDYYDREEFAVANCVPTAEGAIETAMRELPVTLHGSELLVIGWGRVGKALAVRLSALGARVTVSARRPGDLAGIAACGLTPAKTPALRRDENGILSRAAVIFNTVPWPILGWEELAVMRPDCLYIELASAPGGLDAEAAACAQLRVIRAPGLPGLVAPVTAAAILRDTLYNIWREQGVTADA